MKRFEHCLAIVIAFSFCTQIFAEAPAVKKTDKTYKLPANPKTPVIVVDFKGGYGPPRTSDEPAMTIYADGKIEMPSRYQNAESNSGKLTGEEFQTLLKFIIEEQKFFECDPKVIKDKIQAAKFQRKQGGVLGFRVADAATASIEVSLNGKTNKVTHYPSGIDESKIEELVHFQAVKKRLLRMQMVIQLGGMEKIAEWLKVANKQLQKEKPHVKPLEMNNFTNGAAQSNGFVSIQFQRVGKTKDGKPDYKNLTMVHISRRPGSDEPRVSVTHKSTK